MAPNECERFCSAQTYCIMMLTLVLCMISVNSRLIQTSKAIEISTNGKSENHRSDSAQDLGYEHREAQNHYENPMINQTSLDWTIDSNVSKSVSLNTTESSYGNDDPITTVTQTPLIDYDGGSSNLQDYLGHNQYLNYDSTTVPTVDTPKSTSLELVPTIEAPSRSDPDTNVTLDTMQALESFQTSQNSSNNNFELRQLQDNGGNNTLETSSRIYEDRPSMQDDQITTKVRLGNLLDVMRHLNTANNNLNNQNRTNLTVSDLKSNKNNWSHQPVRWSAEDHGPAPIVITTRQPLLINARNDLFSWLKKNDVAPSSLEPSPSKLEAAVTNAVESSERNSSDSSGDDKSPEKKLSGMIKYDLVSPYSADFNPGYQFNRLSTQPKKDHLAEISILNRLINASHDERKVFLIQQSKQRHYNQASSESSPTKVPLLINSKKNKNTTDKMHQNSQLNPVVHYSDDNEVKAKKSTRPIKVDLSKQVKLKPNKTNDVKTNNLTSITDSKRGERHASHVEKSNSSSINNQEDLANKRNYTLADSKKTNQISDHNIKLGDPRKHTLQNFESSTQSTTKETQVLHSNVKVGQFDDDIPSKKETNINQNYLDDPHKKSLYYSTEIGGMFTDYDNPKPVNDVRSGMGGNQLTVGELALQHGVPFRLQPPLGHEYKSMTRPYEDHGMPSESDNLEEIVYMPYNYRPDQAAQAPMALTQNGIKLDDEMKQKIAMKAFEIVNNNSPEFSEILLDSIGDNYVSSTPQAQHSIVNPALLKYYANILTAAAATTTSYDGSLNPVYQNQIHQPSASIPSNPIHTSTNPLAYMLPIAAASDEHAGSYVYPIPAPITSSNLNQSIRGFSNNRTVNLMLTDLANRWTLTRMPDLIPIPLAATVPGYLIRLPNGKILAAALTNSFSIQGIQGSTQAALNSNYRNFLNQRLKSLIKANVNTNSHKQRKQLSQALGSSTMLKPILLPAASSNQLTSASLSNLVIGGRPKINVSPALGSGIGLLPHKILNQLTTSIGKQSFRANHGSSVDLNRVRAKGNKNVKRKIVKLTKSPFPEPMLSDKELEALPMADPNEPVFSFADESQLLDSPEYQLAVSNLNQQQASRRPITYGNNYESLFGQQQYSSNDESDPSNLIGINGHVAKVRARLNQALNLKDTSMGDDLIYGNRKRHSSPTSKVLNKLETAVNWLTRKRTARLPSSSGIKICLGKLVAI